MQRQATLARPTATTATQAYNAYMRRLQSQPLGRAQRTLPLAQSFGGIESAFNSRPLVHRARLSSGERDPFPRAEQLESCWDGLPGEVQQYSLARAIVSGDDREVGNGAIDCTLRQKAGTQSHRPAFIPVVASSSKCTEQWVGVWCGRDAGLTDSVALRVPCRIAFQSCAKPARQSRRRISVKPPLHTDPIPPECHSPCNRYDVSL